MQSDILSGMERKTRTKRKNICYAFASRHTVTERFQEQCIEAHNHFRALHGISRLRWSDDLAKRAQFWAQKIADIGFVLYQEDPEIGENISVIDKEDMPEARGDLLTRMWYDEIQLYDYDKPGWRRETTHFSQMMWRNSVEMGQFRPLGTEYWVAENNRCHFIRTKIKGIKSIVVIAMYRPAGNSNKPGDFVDNVAPPKYRVRYREHQASGMKSSASQTKLLLLTPSNTPSATAAAGIVSNGGLGLLSSSTPVHTSTTPQHQLYHHHTAYAPASASPAANAMATPGRFRRGPDQTSNPMSSTPPTTSIFSSQQHPSRRFWPAAAATRRQLLTTTAAGGASASRSEYDLTTTAHTTAPTTSAPSASSNIATPLRRYR